MKRIFSTLMIIAAAAMSFTSCQKQEVKDSEMIQVSGLTFTSEKPSFDDETKTEWTGETIQWSKDDKIRIAYTCNGIWQNAEGTATKDEKSGEKTAKIYASSALEAAAEIAQFIVPEYFKSSTEGIYEFYGLYPSTVCSSTNMKYAPSVTVEIPAEQTPSTESFDAKADLMAAKSPQTYTGIPDDPISLLWTRIVAHGHLTLKGLQTVGEEKISTITLTADSEADMVGQHYLYLDTYNVVKANGNNTANVLTINADNLSIDEGNVTFWACFLPCVVKSLKVEVETDMATYTRIIETCSLDFKQNARNILSINMASAERVKKEEDTSDYSGTYAIVAYRNSESLYYYLTNEQTSSSPVRLVAKSAGNTRPAEDVTLNASKLWNVSKSGSVYTIQSVASNKYVSWKSGNSAIMSETGLQFTVTKQDGTFNFINEDRYLSLNSTKGSDYFAMYAGTQTQNLYLIKAVEGEEPAPTLTGIKVEGQTTTFTVGDTFKFDGTVTATYSDFTTADVTDYATFSGYDMSSAGDQKVTVSYDGKTCEYPITVKEASTGGDNENTETKYYVKVTSAPTDWSGTYLIVYEDGKIAFDGNLTTLDAVKNTVDVTIEDGKIEATDAMKARQFTINASGHIQSASGYYIGQTSDTNGLKSNKTTSYTNTFSLNTDGTVNVVSGGAYLRYNATSGQERFRYYKSSSYTGQEAISLYKLQ